MAPFKRDLVNHSAQAMSRPKRHMSLPAAAEALKGTAWLTPFGVDVRYADDAAQMLPGDEVKAIEDARLAKEVALRIVNSE
jgi:hypothetical protein